MIGTASRRIVACSRITWPIRGCWTTVRHSAEVRAAGFSRISSVETTAEAAAHYRSQVLVAFSEVENNLAAIRYLAEQAAAQERAVVGSVRAAGGMR